MFRSLILSIAAGTFLSACSGMPSKERAPANDGAELTSVAMPLTDSMKEHWSLPGSSKINAFVIRNQDLVAYGNQVVEITKIRPGGFHADGIVRHTSGGGRHQSGEAEVVVLDAAIPQSCYTKSGFFLCSGVQIQNVDGNVISLKHVFANGLAVIEMQHAGKPVTQMLHLDNLQVVAPTYLKTMYVVKDPENQMKIGEQWSQSHLWLKK